MSNEHVDSPLPGTYLLLQDRITWGLTLFATIVAVIMSIMLSRQSTTVAGMGDWGDFIGGFATIITFIWLITGHYHNQRQIESTNRELKEQMDLTRELVGALTRIASGTQVQAAQALVDAEPRFAHVSSTEITPPGNAFLTDNPSGHIAFQNDGGSVDITRVESQTPSLQASLEGHGICNKGGRVRVLVSSQGPIRKCGQIKLSVTFKDNFGRYGRTLIDTPSFDGSPKIVNEMGSVDSSIAS